MPGEEPGFHDRRALQGAAICEAMQRPNMRFVPVKTEDQQARLMEHRARQGFVAARTACIAWQSLALLAPQSQAPARVTSLA